MMSDELREPTLLGSRKTSPTAGMADSIASLPAMPSKSVPGTPFGFGGAGGGGAGVGKRVDSGEGLSHGQRGFSNPDLARAFGKVGGGFSVGENARVGRLYLFQRFN